MALWGGVLALADVTELFISGWLLLDESSVCEC